MSPFRGTVISLLSKWGRIQKRNPRRACKHKMREQQVQLLWLRLSISSSSTYMRWLYQCLRCKTVDYVKLDLYWHCSSNSQSIAIREDHLSRPSFQFRNWFGILLWDPFLKLIRMLTLGVHQKHLIMLLLVELGAIEARFVPATVAAEKNSAILPATSRRLYQRDR